MKAIDLASARRLLDFSGQDPSLKTLASGQLKAAVALYNMLHRGSFAYLADEVGMGKTYIALGVVALLRHLHPSLRVLFIAPSENIQEKWQKDYKNFIRENYCLVDHRVKNFSGSSAAPAISCGNLEQFARALGSGHYADFFLRMTSFSFSIKSDEEMKKKEQRLRSIVPGRAAAASMLYTGNTKRDKEAFKVWYAKVLNRLLPHFDLVIIDEAHNLKRDVDSSDRNRLLSIVLGTYRESGAKALTRSKINKALLLSATPYDQDYRQLHRQMALVGKDELFPFEEGLPDEAMHDIIRKFMVRRLSQLQISTKSYTRNMYRREWREGGVVPHRELEVQSDLQRLVVALFQKKVSEILNNGTFQNSYQMGMLASFESFFVTSKARKAKGAEQVADREASDEEAEAAFDANQTDNTAEKEGIDSSTVDRIVKSYKERFDSYLPHPKMDAVVDRFQASFETGEKHLVFARRVMTVPELRDKLCERYDAWMMARLRKELPAYSTDLDHIFNSYRRDHRKYRIKEDVLTGKVTPDLADLDPSRAISSHFLTEIGSSSNFFSWFFVHDSSDRYLPSRMKKALISNSQSLSTFFEENWLTLLLGNDAPLTRLADQLGLPPDTVRKEVSAHASACYRALWKVPAERKFEHRRSFLSVQKAGLLMLSQPQVRDQALRDRARQIVTLFFEESWALPAPQTATAIPNFERFITAPTFFSELRKRPELYREIFAGAGDDPYFANGQFQKSQVVLRELIASSLRLGQGVIGLYCDLIKVRKGFQLGIEDAVVPLLKRFVARLVKERRGHREGVMSTYRELRDIRENLKLLIKINFPDALEKKMVELTGYFANILKEQAPVAGMWGGVNKRSVQQFRMPGYPYILVSTDVLQEGEDLHTFCSSIIHYGISWTPTAIEQKTGRIDRVGSLASRRFSAMQNEPGEGELIQAYFPYLKDTVEVYQVRKLCRRMNRFLERLHTFAAPEREKDSQVQLDTEIHDTSAVPEQIVDYLSSPFEVSPHDLNGDSFNVGPNFRKENRNLLAHFKMIATSSSSALGWSIGHEGRSGLMKGEWDGVEFELALKSARACGSVLISCTSTLPMTFDKSSQTLRQFSFVSTARLLAVPDSKDDSYRLSVQGEFFFDRHETQVEEVNELVRRVVTGHRNAVAPKRDAAGPAPLAAHRSALTTLKKLEDLCREPASWLVRPHKVKRVRGQLNIHFRFGERMQEVAVSFRDKDLVFSSLGSSPDLHGQLRAERRIALTWERNCKCDVVDFHFDGDGALRGRIHHPSSSIGANQFRYYTHTLAREMDRVEQILHQDDTF